MGETVAPCALHGSRWPPSPHTATYITKENDSYPWTCAHFCWVTAKYALLVYHSRYRRIIPVLVSIPPWQNPPQNRGMFWDTTSISLCCYGKSGTAKREQRVCCCCCLLSRMSLVRNSCAREEEGDHHILHRWRTGLVHYSSFNQPCRLDGLVERPNK